MKKVGVLLILLFVIMFSSFSSAFVIKNHYCGDGIVDYDEECDDNTESCVDCKCGGGMTCEEAFQAENCGYWGCFPSGFQYVPICGTCFENTINCGCGDGIANEGNFGFSSDNWDECDLGSMAYEFWESNNCYPPNSSDDKACTFVDSSELLNPCCVLPTADDECSVSGIKNCEPGKKLICNEGSCNFECVSLLNRKKQRKRNWNLNSFYKATIAVFEYCCFNHYFIRHTAPYSYFHFVHSYSYRTSPKMCTYFSDSLTHTYSKRFNSMRNTLTSKNFYHLCCASYL